MPLPSVNKGNVIPDELRFLLLGYQNDGGLLPYRKRLVGKDYEPGTFRLSEITFSSPFLAKPVPFDEWLDTALDAELETLRNRYGRLLRRHSTHKLKNKVKTLLETRTTVGNPLKYDVWFQEYSDVLRRMLLYAMGRDPDEEFELFPSLTIERTAFVFKVLKWLETHKAPGLRDWLYLSIAAGLMGVDKKSPHTAASTINKDFVISLASLGEDETAAVARVGEAVYGLTKTACRIDASEWLVQYLAISRGIRVKILSFPDDYIETIFLLRYYSELLLQYDHVEIDCVPRMIRCGNDARFADFGPLLKQFPTLKKNPRFRVHDAGPKLGTVNITKLHPRVASLIEECDFIDTRGSRNYEMMQGINKDAFFGFMVCRELSEATTGLFAKNTPFIYIRQASGEISFSGFRERISRKQNGQMLCRVTAIDNREKWEGGHLASFATWSKEKKERYSAIQQFYSKGAIDFHKKYGDLLEVEVRNALNTFRGRVLVVGCASGKEVGYLCQRQCDAMGIDFSVEAIHLARSQWPHLWDRFYVEDFYNTAHFHEGEFDGIVANAALVHLLLHEDLGRLYEQFAKRLCKGGNLFVRVLEKAGLREEYDSHLFNLRRWFVYYKLDELVQTGQQHGLRVIRKEKVPHMQYKGIWWNTVLYERA